MRLKELALSIDTSSSVPLFLQVVEGMVDAIQKKRIPPGTALPGSRALAEHLSVSRTTIVAAFAELEAQGWIEARGGSGTYVVEKLPMAISNTRIPDSNTVARKAPTFDLPTLQDLVTDQMAKVYKLSEDLPDSRLLPTDELGRAYHRALRRRAEESLEYGEPRGHKDLRKALNVFLGERRGMSAEPDSILVTRGNRMGMNLIAQGLLKAGDLVAVEDPGNPVAWECFKQAHARLLPIPVDEEGLNPDLLEEHLRNEKIRLLYLSPRFQIPTTVGLSQARRKRLLKLARDYRFGIVEDDSEADYTFESRPSLPMAAGEGVGTVIHLFSFSRLLAPGVRLGILTGPQLLVDRLAKLRQRMDWQGDHVLERALAELLIDGEIQRHIQRVRKIYLDRRDLTIACLQELFESRLTVDPPEGGLSLWVRTNPSVDLELWSQRCASKGLLFQTGRSYTFDHRPLQAFRLGFASFNSGEMAEILTRMQHEMP